MQGFDSNNAPTLNLAHSNLPGERQTHTQEVYMLSPQDELRRSRSVKYREEILDAGVAAANGWQMPE